ncbi:MAG: ATP-binding protein [Acidobacteria bacterium]|nr:ATP-binding protein [Acidobacteriota bacterium]
MQSQRTVLIVDPDIETRDALGLILASQGYRIQIAPDEAAACEALRRQAHPVVVWEQEDGNGGGLEFVRRAREIQPDARVILCGGDRATALGCLREQAFAFFRKPYSSQMLFEMVDRAFEGGHWRTDIGLDSASPDWVALNIRAKFAAGERVIQFLRELADQFPAVEAEELTAALREILLNAIEHGGRTDARQTVRLNFIRTSRGIICSILDPGEGFSLESIPHAAVSNPPDDQIRHAEVREERGLRPGGFGIMMARNLVDELVYNQKGNEAIIVKYRKSALSDFPA